MVAMVMEYGDTDARVPSSPCHGVTTEFLSTHTCSVLSPVFSSYRANLKPSPLTFTLKP